MMKPVDCDHPVWKKALTYRQLLSDLKSLSEKQLDDAVQIREPLSNGGSTVFPIHEFSYGEKEPLLSRLPMSEPQPSCKIYIL